MASPIVSLNAHSVERGEPIEIELTIERADDETAIQLDVNFVNAVAGGLQASAGARLPSSGTAHLSLPTDSWMNDAVFRPFGLTLFDDAGAVTRTMSFLFDEIIQVREPGEKALPQEALLARQRMYADAQQKLYSEPLGNTNEPGVERWQAVVVVERLFMQTALLLPGVEIQPMDIGNPAASEAELIDLVMSTLQPGFRPTQGSQWSERSQRARPVCVLQFENIYARSLEEADRLLSRRCDEVLDLLAVNRRSAAAVLGTVLTQPAKGVTKLKLGVPEYTGNLAVGQLAGESQLSLTTQDAAARADPLLALALSLIRSAYAEHNPDFAYFRFWSVLDVLADDRVERNEDVFLPGGQPLVGQGTQQKTTSDAAPRVYVYLGTLLKGIDLQSVVRPAPDLWVAVEAWYSRRNATAHAGRFDPTRDPRAARSPGIKTLAQDGAEDPAWLRSLREVATVTVSRELRAFPGGRSDENRGSPDPPGARD